MSVAYLSLLMLVLAPLMANARPATTSETASRVPKQLVMPSYYVPWVQQPAHEYPRYGYEQNPFLSPFEHRMDGPVDERFGLALLLSLLGGGGGEGEDDDRYPSWSFRPLAYPQQPFTWPMSALLG